MGRRKRDPEHKLQNKLDRKTISKHHIYPKSRFPSRAMDPTNKAEISVYWHRRFHDLFETKTPEEAQRWLHTYFYGLKPDIIQRNIAVLEELLKACQLSYRKTGG